MCDPVSAVIGTLAVIGGVNAISEDQRRHGEAATNAARPDPVKQSEQAARESAIANQNANKPKRASAAEALYGNPVRQGNISAGGGDGGAASTGISTQVNAAPTALTLGKNDLLGQ